jgi:hypothetical protein
MSDIHYWSPGDASNGATLGSDDHYLRLGGYVAAAEPGAANIAVDGVAQGIFFYTSGKYSLKSTEAAHIAVSGPVDRTVKSGDLAYANERGNLSITTAKGGIEITASGTIHIAAKQVTTDDSKSITIDAGKHDIYFIQGKYTKETSKDQDKIVEAHNHKTNIGVLISSQLGPSDSHSETFEMGYTTLSTGFTVAECSAKGLTFGFENNKSSLTLVGALGVLLLDSKKVFLDEEFSCVKNEKLSFKIEDGLAGARRELATAWQRLTHSSQRASEVEIELTDLQI